MRSEPPKNTEIRRKAYIRVTYAGEDFNTANVCVLHIDPNKRAAITVEVSKGVNVVASYLTKKNRVIRESRENRDKKQKLV